MNRDRGSMTTTSRNIGWLAPIALLFLACGAESDQVVFEMQAESFANSDWSSPENLAPINSTFNEQAPSLSPDGLTLYFGSNRPRPGGSTDTDLWVSHRSCTDCAWETPANLGPIVNSSVGDNGPSLSLDGHALLHECTDWRRPQRHLRVAPRGPERGLRVGSARVARSRGQHHSIRGRGRVRPERRGWNRQLLFQTRAIPSAPRY